MSIVVIMDTVCKHDWKVFYWWSCHLTSEQCIVTDVLIFFIIKPVNTSLGHNMSETANSSTGKWALITHWEYKVAISHSFILHAMKNHFDHNNGSILLLWWLGNRWPVVPETEKELLAHVSCLTLSPLLLICHRTVQRTGFQCKVKEKVSWIGSSWSRLVISGFHLEWIHENYLLCNSHPTTCFYLWECKRVKLYKAEWGYDKGLLYFYFKSGWSQPVSLCKPLHAWSWNVCFLSPSMAS